MFSYRSFKLSKNYALDIAMLYAHKAYDFSIIRCDISVAVRGSHTPRFAIDIAICGINLLDLCIYNVNHEDDS